MARERAALSNRGQRRRPGAWTSLRFFTLVSVTVALGVLVTLSPCHLVTLSPCQGQEGERMPLFRRLLLPPQRLEEELKRVDEGVLVRLPLSEFDALVQRAERTAHRKEPPRLLEARYHATLREESLIGEGQWKLVHKGPGPGLLNLESFNLALRQARFENGEARIAAFDGKTPALLVETAGERTVSLDWSARAEASREGLQFHLEIPPCPVALLEVDVPVGRGVMVLNDGALLSGPHEAETADLRRWKIVCGGRRLDIRILSLDRPAGGGEQTSAPFVRQKTTQKLRPQGLDATFELTLDGLARGVRRLVCECDPELRLRDVIGPNVESCSFQSGGAKPSRLTIHLREAMRAGTWQVLCLAPLNGGSGLIGGTSVSPVQTSGGTDVSPVVWRSPGLRLVNGVPRGETLTLWLDPRLRIESWDAGNFRLSSADLDGLTDAQVLTLQGGSLGPPRRPTARLQVQRVQFRTHQLAWWRCGASGMALTVQIGWDVSQGRLFQLPVRLPHGWRVDKVEMNPALLLRDWRVRRSEGKAELVVDLARPLTPRTHGDSERLPLVIVHLRPGWSGPFTGKKLPLPNAVPLGARLREGALALDCDEQLFHLDVSTKAERSQPESEGPWGERFPVYYYRYRVSAPSNGPPVKGTLQVRARPPRLQARCRSEVFVAGGGAAIETHLLLQVEAGSPETIDVALSAGDGREWRWDSEAPPGGEETTNNRVHHAERVYSGELSAAVPLLAAAKPLQAAVLLAAQPRGERWRLTLARPLRARETLHLHARRQLQPRPDPWDVPLPVVLGADRMEGEVHLYLAGGDLVHLRGLGLREAASPATDGTAPWRTYRYGQGEVRLSLSGQALASDRAKLAAIDRATLVVSVGEGGVLRHHFSFAIANWNEGVLPLRLPPGSRPLAVQVDGHWLSRLLPAAPDEDPGASSAEARELALPMPTRRDAHGGETAHRFEVVYSRPLPAWRPWQTLQAPAPRLPVAPLAFRRIWRLPSTLTPLHEGRYQSLPGTSAAGKWHVLPHRFAELFHLPGPWRQWDPLRQDRQADACAELDQAVQELCRGHAHQKMSLREAVGNLAFVYLKDRYNLLVDVLALREAGVGPDTPLILQPPLPTGDAADRTDWTPPWAEWGLVAVPARSAILLTTTSGCGARLRQPLSAEVETALAAAARHGQDPSGRFRSALTWLHPDRVAVPDKAPQRMLSFEDDRADWSEWEPVAGLAEDRLMVVRRDVVTATGLAFVVFLGLLFWVLRRRSVRLRLMLLLLALGLFGLGVLWLPASLRDLAWWPLAASCAGAALWYVRAIVRKTRNPPSTLRKSKQSLSAAAMGAVFVFAILGWHGRAAAPTPATVYLVPAAAAADKPTVLAPAALLDRLKVLAQPAPLAPGGPRTVLLDASYEGQLVDEGQEAEFTAVFSAHSRSEGASTLTLPLSGVRLMDEVLLDGARSAPVAQRGPQEGYSLLVRGCGRHKIELRFRVPVVGTVEDRNVLFTVPSLLRSRLSWRVPAGAVEPQVLVKYGAQWTKADADGQRLEADLGALPRPVHLHWYQPRSPTKATYQAAYVWDLGVEANRLTTWLRYRVARGAVKTLEVDLPASLEVGSAAAQRTVAAAAPPWRTRFQLRDWYVTRGGGRRTLHLEFPYPISGDFQATLELLPRTPLSSQAELPLPWPRRVQAGGPHYLAFRTRVGLNAQRHTSQFLTRIDAVEFAPDWPAGPRLQANFSGIAYRIPANPKQPPKLSLRLRHTPPVVQADVDLTVQAAAQRAEIEAVAALEAPNKDLVAIEWDLPSPRCIIASVAGEDMRSWKQNGPRLLVWLKRTTAATRLRLSGWLPLGQRSQLGLNALRLHPPGKQHTHLRLRAGGDRTLVAVRTQNLQPVKSEIAKKEGNSDLGPRIWEFETEELSYRVQCQVRAAANARARVLTLAEVVDGELHFKSTMHYTIPQGELRHVQLRLRNWQEEKVEVQAEHVTLWPGPRRSSGERSWLLPLQPGVREHYQVTLRGLMPLDKAAGSVPMPEVIVAGVERPEYYLAVAGADLTGQAKGPLHALKSPVKELRPFWPGAAQRLERAGGRAWRVGASEWQLRLQPHTRRREPEPIRAYLMEQWSAVVDGRRWMHEARCWLRHEGSGDLLIDFAAPARILAAAVDGLEVMPLHPASARVWLPLPGRPGVRCLHLRWLYQTPEPLDRPNLTPPRLADAIQGTTLWTVMVPAGWEADTPARSVREGTFPLASASGSYAGAARQAALALARAEAQFRIRQDLAKARGGAGVSAALSACQRRFAVYCRYAQEALDLGGDRGGVKGPQGQGLGEWLQLLNAECRMQNAELKTDDGFHSSFCILHSALDSGSGTPMSWLSLPDAGPLRLRLSAREKQQTRHTLAVSGQWLGGLAIVGILSFLPFLLTHLRRFWPEQLALLAALGWHVAGLTSVVLLLLLAAVGARVVLLLHRLSILVRKRCNPPSTMTPLNLAEPRP